MGTALRNVTSLDVILHVTDDRSSSGEKIFHWDSHHFPGQLSETAGSELASLLAASCPEVCHLGMTGGLGHFSLRLFGSQWAKLTSVELLPGPLLIELFDVGRKELLLPNMTHMRVVDACTGHVKRSLSLMYNKLWDWWLDQQRCSFQKASTHKLLSLSHPPSGMFCSQLYLGQSECMYLTSSQEGSSRVR